MSGDSMIANTIVKIKSLCNNIKYVNKNIKMKVLFPAVVLIWLHRSARHLET
jgi:hypothetical protein